MPQFAKQPLSTGVPGRRTFYRRYVHTADPAGCTKTTGGGFIAPPLDCGGDDQREPLGLKYVARLFDGTTPPPGAAASPTTSFFNLWRGSAGNSSMVGGHEDLLGQAVGKCNTSETEVSLTSFEGTTSMSRIAKQLTLAMPGCRCWLRADYGSFATLPCERPTASARSSLPNEPLEAGSTAAAHPTQPGRLTGSPASDLSARCTIGLTSVSIASCGGAE